MTIPDESGPHVAVVLASAGRPDVLADVLDDVARQTWPGVFTVLAVPDEASLPAGDLPDGVVVAPFVRGLTAQRNAGVGASRGATHVFFFDDDSVVREDFVERGMRFFEEHPDVVALTGRVLLDGATGDAVPRDQALAELERSASAAATGAWSSSRTLYGCNFAVRREAAPQERFDERLPLYGWLEDHDLARRMMRHGRLAKVDDCVIVHRGVKSGGRTAHTRLGYAQVMNPCYLVSTGSFPVWLAAWEVFRPVAKNVVRAVGHAESPWRRERLRGNGLAVLDVLRRRFTPERGLQLH